jgi:acetyltransferase-like isoleucine patch superfamily enzyme
MKLIKRLKGYARHLLYHPRGMEIGATSVIRFPRRIVNPQRISVGSDTRIYGGVRLEAYDSYAGVELNSHLIIGNDVYIGYNTTICAVGRIEIGDGCVLSDNVFIEDGDHGFDPSGPAIMRQPLVTKGPITIGKRCFIGNGAAIVSNVALGDFCVVGARAVVTKSFPAYSMVAGAPAKLIKVYDRDRREWVAPS